MIVRGADEPMVIGDIAVDYENGRNADPCTSTGCKWPKSSDGLVYVPYIIANHFSMSLILYISMTCTLVMHSNKYII